MQILLILKVKPPKQAKFVYIFGFYLEVYKILCNFTND